MVEYTKLCMLLSAQLCLRVMCGLHADLGQHFEMGTQGLLST